MTAFLHWYWRRLKDMGVFAAGYVCGGIVVAIFMTVPALARAVLALAGS